MSRSEKKKEEIKKLLRLINEDWNDKPHIKIYCQADSNSEELRKIIDRQQRRIRKMSLETFLESFYGVNANRFESLCKLAFGRVT